jgi:prolyl oligopeptidase
MAQAESGQAEDPFLWLEEITGERALEWVEGQNRVSALALAERPEFAALYQRLLSIYDSAARIPMVTARGGWYYNFWQDESRRRGVWRRTPAAAYAEPEPHWEVLLDIDALGRAEGENWVFKGAQCLYPRFERALINLSRGGGDAQVVREFDLGAREFVAGGFALPEAKGSLAWIDEDSVYVSTDFGPGSLTAAGYPRQVKIWRRGTPLAAAELVFEGQQSDVRVVAERVRGWVAGRLIERDFIQHVETFYSGALYLREGGELVRVPIPADAFAESFADQLLVTLRSDWTVTAAAEPVTWPRGATLAIGLDAFLAGARHFTALYTPGARKSQASLAVLHGALIVNELDEMQARAYVWRLDSGSWTCTEFPLPEGGHATLSAVDPDCDDAAFLIETSPLQPTTLGLVAAGARSPVRLKSAPAFFSAAGAKVEYANARSADGTQVPYFVVTPAGFVANGTAPTLLYAYGGFEIALLPPQYNATVGAAWLEAGGVYVIAGLRGGGEFGPEWHQAAKKENKQRSYDDLIAVALDLSARRITSAPHLGIRGGSNGGLLVGAVMVQRPELFGAVVCEVPLLDMRRYHRLLAGASWMGEYGDPDDPGEWDFISRYSPYQRVTARAEQPPVLFLSSTRDDRVHPGHARKMAAKMLGQGARVLYYENTEGGHAGAADNTQAAYMQALAYTFLTRELR